MPILPKASSFKLIVFYTWIILYLVRVIVCLVLIKSNFMCISYITIYK